MDRNLSIIVAEDNDLNRKVMQALLEHLGHDTVLVENGDDAISTIARGHFDVALLDIQMPGRHGLAVAAEIRATMHSDDLPFLVAATGLIMPEGAAYYTERGFDAFLEKPVSLDRLSAVLEQAGRESGPRTQAAA